MAGHERQATNASPRLFGEYKNGRHNTKLGPEIFLGLQTGFMEHLHENMPSLLGSLVTDSLPYATFMVKKIPIKKMENYLKDLNK